MLAPIQGDDMQDEIDYGSLMHQAMHGLIRQVLTTVADQGLPGAHHFFLSFDPRHPGVAMADWLHDRYPTEMTIVIQHWFENLMVDDEGFTITLNFGNQPEPLRIPFDALLAFVDPSVEFGLRFESHADDADDTDTPAEDPPPAPEPPSPTAEEVAPAAGGGEVVQLDRFRKP